MGGLVDGSRGKPQNEHVKPFPNLADLATRILAGFFLTICVENCPAQELSVETDIWGTTADGKQVERATLTNSQGVRVQVMTYGATLLGIETPDRNGRLANITLSLGSFVEYERGHPLFGSIVGRYANRIDTGALLPVEGTPFDLRQLPTIAAAIAGIDGGLDHCYAQIFYDPDRVGHEDDEICAELIDPASGRFLTMSTSMPGVQVYTANHLSPTLKSPDGAAYGPHHGVCLETQYFPDTPNRPEFPSSVLRPGETYSHRTTLRFGVLPFDVLDAIGVEKTQ